MTRATKERIGRKGTNRRLVVMVLAALSVNDCSMPMLLGGWVSGSSGSAAAAAATSTSIVAAESVNGVHLRQRQRQQQKQNEIRVEKRRRSGIFPGPYEAEDYQDPRNRPATAFEETTPSPKSSSSNVRGTVGAESGTDRTSAATEGLAQFLDEEESGTQQGLASSLRHRKNEELMMLFPEEYWFLWNRNDDSKNGDDNIEGRVQDASSGCGQKHEKYRPKAFKSDKQAKHLKRMVSGSREGSGDADSGSNNNNNNRYLSYQRAINFDAPTLPPFPSPSIVQAGTIECPEDPPPVTSPTPAPFAYTSPRVPSSQTKAPSGATNTNNGSNDDNNNQQLTRPPAQEAPWKDPTDPPASLPIGETIFEPTLKPTRKPSPTPKPAPSPTRAPSEVGAPPDDSARCSANEKCAALSLTGACCPSTSGDMLQCCDAYGIPSSAPGASNNENGNFLPTRSPLTVIEDGNNGSGNGNIAPAATPTTEGGNDGTGDGNNLPTTSPVTGNGNGNGNGNDEDAAIGVCNRVRNQNHSAILAQQEQGTVGPSFLYSVAVSIVHEEAQAPSEQVLVYLDTLNVPIALAISGCEYQIENYISSNNNNLDDIENNGSTSSTRRSKPGERQRRLQASAVASSGSNSTSTSEIAVEYSEVEAWRENPASSPIGEDSVCFDAPTEDGIACNVFKSRVIIFLPNQQQQAQSESTATTRNRSGNGATEEVLRDRINDALTEYGYLVSAYPGIISMDVDSIELASSPQPPGSAPDGANSDPTTNASTGSSLSADTTTIVGSVAACVGGLLLGAICVVWWKRSPYYDDTHKHSRFDDSSEDYWPTGSPDWTKQDPEGETPTHDRYGNSDRNSFTSPQPFDMRDNTLSPNRKTRFAVGGLPEEEGYFLPPNYVRKPTNFRSHRGRKINRVDNLLDKGREEERYSMFRSTMPTLSSEWSTDDDTDAREIVDESFDDEQHNNNNSHPFASCGVGTPPFSFPFSETQWHPPCSSPTCTICEDRRTNGIGRDEYLWLKMLRPLSPEKIPTFDPTRSCLCDDTVVL